MNSSNDTEQVIADLKAARAELVARGRNTGWPLAEDGSVCAVGAVIAAVDPQSLHLDSMTYDVRESKRGMAVVAALRQHLPIEYQQRDGRSHLYDVAEYNDTHRGAQGDQDVLNLFEKAICDLGGAL